MHDHYGQELRVGDLVMIPCRVIELQAFEDFCNVSLQSFFGRRPDDAKERIYAINTGVLLRANVGDEHENTTFKLVENEE